MLLVVGWRVGLQVGVIRVGEGVLEGELSDGELDERDAQRPDVRFDGVSRALDALRLIYRGVIMSTNEISKEALRTLMYMDVPTNVLAMELMSSPETPKSQSLMSPDELHRIFDGLISASKRNAMNKLGFEWGMESVTDRGE